jgi:hypothetical protein
LEYRNEKYEQLTVPCWLPDLAFLTDLTLKVYVLNLELKGKYKQIVEVISCESIHSQTGVMDI